MLYNIIKIIHIISASVLFGTGMGTAFYMFYVNFKGDIDLIAKATKQVVIADWLFTATSGVIQALTGFTMIYLKSYSIFTLWVGGSIAGYLIAGACWLPVVWLQMKCRDIATQASADNVVLPKKYYKYFNCWWVLGIPAFIALMFVYYLMSNKIV